MRILLLAIVILTTSVNSYASEWIPFFKSDSGIIFQYNTKVIKSANNIVKVWEIMDNLPNEPVFYNIKSYKHLVEINCQEYKTRITMQYINYKNRSVPDSDTSVDNWRDIAPSTSSDVLAGVVCNNQ